MANAPDTATYLLVTNTGALPQARDFGVEGGLTFNPGLPSGDAVVGTTGNLSAIDSLAGTNGYLAFGTAANPSIFQRTFTTSPTIAVTNGDGSVGNPTWNVVDSSNIQKVNVQLAAVTKSTQSTINFVQGAGILLNIQDVGGAAQVSISTAGGGTLGTVTSVSADSTSGLVFSVDTPTTTPVIHFDLPGSNAGVIDEGDLLIGNNAHAYIGLGIGGANTVLTSNAHTASWQPIPAGPDWWTIPAGDDVDMGGHGIDALKYLEFLGSTVTVPDAGKAIIRTLNDPDLHLSYATPTLPDQIVVTTDAATYSTPFSILFGNPTTPGLNYMTTTVAPIPGYVVGYDGTTVKWMPNTVDTLPSDFVLLVAGPVFGQVPLANVGWIYVPDPNITATSVVSAWPQGCFVPSSLDINPAEGHISVTTYPNGIDSNPRGYLIQSSDEEAGTGVGYQVIKY